MRITLIRPSVHGRWRSEAWTSAMLTRCAGTTVEFEDARHDYGERRMVCYGMLAGRLVVIGYTQRDFSRHVFSMRKANDREKARLAAYFEI